MLQIPCIILKIMLLKLLFWKHLLLLLLLDYGQCTIKKKFEG